MIERTLVGVVMGAWLVASGSAQAHHSISGAYDLSKEAKLSGSFEAFHFVNPHSSLKLLVKNADGSTTEWTFTGGSVSTLARLHIGRTGPNALRAGDQITVTYTPARDGKSPVGVLNAITYADGHTVMMRSRK